jgi:hypothetical protein
MPLGQRLTILLKVLGVFLLMGPPVGALTFFAGMGVYGSTQTGDIAGIWWLSLFGLIYGVPLSYLMGIAPAAAAGFILGATAALHRVPGHLFSTATGFFVGLWLAYAGGTPTALLNAETASDYVPIVLLIATCLVATVLCWAVARCTIRRPPAPSSPPIELARPPA